MTPRRPRASFPALVLGALVASPVVGRVAAAEEATPAPTTAPDAARTTPPTELRIEQDDAIATAVSEAMADDRRVNAMNVKVAVKHGVVTLTGRSHDGDEREAAEAIARRVRGVRDVENQLVVAEPGAPPPGASMIPEVPSPPR